LKLNGTLLTCVFTCTSAFAATDPFVGTWVYNSGKSPKPTITYAIKDLGGNRYALTGSTGTTIEVKADGIPIETPTGATVSFNRLDDHDWEMVRNDDQNMVRTYNISPDDTTLTLHDVYTSKTGTHYETIVRYARRSPGNGIFGEWQSTSIEEKTLEEAPRIVITSFGTDGLSFSVPADKHLSELNFDGRMYADSGAGDKKGHSTSGRRVNEHFLQIESQVDGRPEYSEEYKVSDDGKTLTIVGRYPNSSVVFTMLWDKQ